MHSVYLVRRLQPFLKETMNILIRLFCLPIFLLFSMAAFAVHPASPVKETKTATLTVNQFLSLDPGLISRKNGHEQAWIKRKLFRYAQHRLNKKVAQGRIQGNDALFQTGLKAEKPNRNGMWSLILGGAGFLFLFASPLSLLSLPLAVGGFIFGLKGLKKDKNPLMAILGIVFSVLIALVFVLAIVFIATYFSWF